MNEELLSLLDSLKGFDERAVLKQHVQNTVVKVVESKVATVQNLDDEVYYVLVKKGRKYLVATLRGRGEEVDYSRLVDALEEPKISPRLTDNAKEYKFEKVDHAMEKVKEDPQKVVDSIDSKYPVYGIVNLTKREVSLVTSKGFNGTDVRSTVDGYFRAFNSEFSGQWSFASTTYSDKLVREAVETASDFASITNKVSVDDGRYDVVLSPMVMGNLFGYLAEMASGLSIVMGESIFYDVKPGTKVASEKLTLLDTPKQDRPMSVGFDWEGTFTRDKAIIEGGVFKTPLLNNEVAELLGMENTGNAGWVYPRAWNLEVKEGEVKREDLLAGNVILFNNNWYTRFQNYVEGQFSTVGRDAVVVYREGKPVGVSPRLRIADSLKNLLRNLEELSRERYLVKWWDAPTPTLTPYALFKGVKLTRA
ncbi:MAG: TldD/PmbA family protein [Candidatus Aramenus sp.]|jgi:PmbA protein|nr:TldD/PmbA family protein [Candidatus Aramenus sp.]